MDAQLPAMHGLRSLLRWALPLACALGVATDAVGAEPPVERAIGTDRFAAGSTVTVRAPVAGDLIAAGGEATVQAPVSGDVLLAAGRIEIAAEVERSLYAVAGQLTVDQRIGRNARLAGGELRVGPNGRIEGGASLAAGRVVVEGAIGGYLQAAGGSVFLNGPIGGDVDVAAGQLELGPQAHIAGRLRYATRESLRQDPAAQIAGGIDRLAPGGGWPVPARVEHSVGRGGSWFWTFGLMLLAATLIAVFPKFSAAAAATLRARPAMSLLAGLAALILTPFAAVLMIVTVIGVPLGIATLALYPVAILVGYVLTGIAIGDWALRQVQPQSAESTGWRVIAALLAVLAIAAATTIPIAGLAIVVVALLVGLGGLARQLARMRLRPVGSPERWHARQA